MSKTTNIANTVANSNETVLKITTLKDIAEYCGVSLATVNNVIVGGYTQKYGKYSPKTIERIKEAVMILNYKDKRSEERKEMTRTRRMQIKEQNNKTKYWYGGSFHSYAEEKARMLELREEGYTNIQIAKKVGRTPKTVWAKIGKQPVEYTMESMREVGLRRRQESETRRRRQLAMKVSEYKAYLLKVEAEERAVCLAEAEAQRVADEAAQKRAMYSKKVVELEIYRKEAEEAAEKLGIKIG